jgi:hypothetical protein
LTRLNTSQLIRTPVLDLCLVRYLVRNERRGEVLAAIAGQRGKPDLEAALDLLELWVDQTSPMTGIISATITI